MMLRVSSQLICGMVAWVDVGWRGLCGAPVMGECEMMMVVS